MITVSIGDIHGQYDMLDRLLMEVYDQSIRDPESTGMRFVFLGDYIDRGPHSRQVIKRLRSLEGDSVVCLRGNHEQLMINCFEQPAGWKSFVMNGGDQTLLSYEGYEDDFEEDRRWMSKLPTSFEDELRIFVHAGIMPKVPLNDQTEQSKMWIRRRFLDFNDRFPKYVVHGHTPTTRDRDDSSNAPYVSANRCNLDTGAVYGGALTAAFFNDLSPQPFHLISVS